jgi:hypothetical protein
MPQLEHQLLLYNRHIQNLKFVSVRQHTSECVSIRQHATAATDPGIQTSKI